MIVSDPKTVEFYQNGLFDRPLGNHGHCRTIIGDFIEVVTARVFGGKRCRCTGTADYCPDVKVGDIYIECKAMGNSNQTMIYDGRLEKDHVFAQSHNLFYAIWSHNVSTKSVDTVEDLQRKLLAGLEWCALIPFDQIDQICLWSKPGKLNSKYGGSQDNPLYGSGYRIPRRFIEPWILFEWNHEET